MNRLLLVVVTVVIVGGLVAVPMFAGAPDQKTADQKTVDQKTADQKPAETKKPIREPDVIFVPTPQEVVDKMLELADVKKTDVVYDLGCGNGIIVVTAAKKYGVKATGFDINPVRVQESLDNVKKNNVENLVTIEEKDIFTLDLSPANVITLYLLPSLNVKLIPQLEKLKPGSRIVSHDFDMQGVTPDKVVHVPSEENPAHTVYLWTTPLKKESKEESKDAKKP
jgi:precorrin-6B methylase 2